LQVKLNFWTPTGWNVGKLEKGDRLYFLLKAPIRKIGGYGHYSYFEKMTPRDAWDNFGKGNGVYDLTELVAKTSGYAAHHSTKFDPNEDREIGCIVLDRPVFFEEDGFFDPNGHGKPFAPQVVTFKYFDEDFDDDSVGFVQSPVDDKEPFQPVDETGSSYKSRRVRDRAGQSVFRQKVLAAYGHRCCVTGESTLKVLDAAHIQPYVNGKSNHVQNGLALRTDLHKLFDAGLLTIDDEYRLAISSRLKSEGYAAYHGRKMLLPDKAAHRPSREALDVHRTVVFRT
jgi:putative restriction endonuclease